MGRIGDRETLAGDKILPAWERPGSSGPTAKSTKAPLGFALSLLPIFHRAPPLFPNLRRSPRLRHLSPFSAVVGLPTGSTPPPHCSATALVLAASTRCRATPKGPASPRRPNAAQLLQVHNWFIDYCLHHELEEFDCFKVGIGHNFHLKATGWKWKLSTCLGGDGISQIRNKSKFSMFPGFDLRIGWKAEYVLPEIHGAVGTGEPAFIMNYGRLQASIDRVEAIVSQSDQY